MFFESSRTLSFTGHLAHDRQISGSRLVVRVISGRILYRGKPDFHDGVCPTGPFAEGKPGDTSNQWIQLLVTFIKNLGPDGSEQ
jgi:hypothetical protein